MEYYVKGAHSYSRGCVLGIRTAPIADHSMLTIAESGKELFPLASKVLVNKRYMGDIWILV